MKTSEESQVPNIRVCQFTKAVAYPGCFNWCIGQPILLGKRRAPCPCRDDLLELLKRLEMAGKGQ